jgi:hypothetical protein
MATRTWKKKAKCSSLSCNFLVELFEFNARVIELEIRIDAALLGVGFFGPRGDFGLEEVEISNAPVGEALAGQAIEFAFGDVQPTAVLRSVNEVETFHTGAVGGVWRVMPSHANSNPPSTNRWRTFSTVCSREPNASQIFS